jgi:hypothetical protein
MLRIIGMFFALFGLVFLIPGLFVGFERAPVETGLWVGLFVALIAWGVWHEDKKRR